MIGTNVTTRIGQVSQPRGGYVPKSQFDKSSIDDNNLGLIKPFLYEKENVHGSVVGMAVDYLTRFIMGNDAEVAFNISLMGAHNKDHLLKTTDDENLKLAKQMASEMNRNLDAKTIINACKLATFDVWLRKPSAAYSCKGHEETNPDKSTINNIKVMVKRCLRFWDIYGPITVAGFDFRPEEYDSEKVSILLSGEGNYGGYSPTITSGDGDYLTKDTLWDFKVKKSDISSKDTLQILVYWIMGQHSCREEFKNITKIGIFNPRRNEIYQLDTAIIPQSVITEVEKDVIQYIT